MAATSTTVTYENLISATLDNVREKLSDNIFRKSVLFAKLHLNGKKEVTEGGDQIRRAVEYDVNTTVQSFQGYDVVPIVPTEFMTDTLNSWKEITGNIALSRRETRINSGTPAIRSLVRAKIGNLERSFGQKLNEMVLKPTTYATADNGGKALTPLSEIISLAAVTTGGIAEATNSWWANQRKRSASSSAATGSLSWVNFKGEMRNFYNTCSRHNDGSPDFVLASQGVAEKYEEALENQVRYGSTEMANLGFNTVMLFGAEVAWDQIVPGTADGVADVGTVANTALLDHDDASYDEQIAYFLNTDFITLVVDSQTDMVTTPWVDHQASGQFARSKSLLLMSELICTNRRAQGVFFGIDPAAITG